MNKSPGAANSSQDRESYPIFESKRGTPKHRRRDIEKLNI
jgi:hypothetical protein